MAPEITTGISENGLLPDLTIGFRKDLPPVGCLRPLTVLPKLTIYEPALSPGGFGSVERETCFKLIIDKLGWGQRAIVFPSFSPVGLGCQLQAKGEKNGYGLSILRVGRKDADLVVFSFENDPYHRRGFLKVWEFKNGELVPFSNEYFRGKKQPDIVLLPLFPGPEVTDINVGLVVTTADEIRTHADRFPVVTIPVR